MKRDYQDDSSFSPPLLGLFLLLLLLLLLFLLLLLAPVLGSGPWLGLHGPDSCRDRDRDQEHGVDRVTRMKKTRKTQQNTPKT